MTSTSQRPPLSQHARWLRQYQAALLQRQEGRRAALRDPDPLPAHVGLWLDRMLAEPKPEKTGSRESSPNKAEQGWAARHQLYSTAIRALTPGKQPGDDPPALAAYRPRYERWRAFVEEPAPGLWRRTLVVEARSRILLHPQSNDSVTDGSLLFHHTYGVPYLPGSALKGAVRSSLWQLDQRAGGNQEEEDSHWKAARQVLLGSLTSESPLARSGNEENPEEHRAQAAAVDFLDALWIPERPRGILPGWSPLALDVVNPHHPHYYTRTGGRDREYPHDTQSPIPIHRLTVAPGSRFLVAMEAVASPPLEPWLDWLVSEILLPALGEQGVGAWTSAGYGRLRPLNWRPASSRRSSPRSTPRMGPAWHRVRLFLEPGPRTLRALLGDGRRATCSAAETDKLLEGLPEDQRQRLMSGKKKKGMPVEARLESRGRALWIRALRMP